MNTQEITRDNITIRILRDICISAGTCTVYAPKTFDIDDEGIAIIKKKEWDKLEKIIAAAKSCPVLAIEVLVNGKVVYPN